MRKDYKKYYEYSGYSGETVEQTKERLQKYRAQIKNLTSGKNIGTTKKGLVKEGAK